MSLKNRAADYGRSYGAHASSGFLHVVLGILVPAALICLGLMVASVPHLANLVNADDAKLAALDAQKHRWVQGEIDDTAGNGAVILDEPAKPPRLVSALVRHPQLQKPPASKRKQKKG